jgi:hypothetical protein
MRQRSISNVPDKCAKHTSRNKRSILETTNSQSKTIKYHPSSTVLRGINFRITSTNKDNANNIKVLYIVI